VAYYCRRLKLLLLIMVVVVGVSACATGTLLFNGDDLSGWQVVGDADWQVKSGELVASGEGDGFITSHQEFKNFSLSLEFWVDATTNSGVYIRCQDRDNINPNTCYELNIWDEHPQQDARTGSIVFKVMPPLVKVNTVGKWNTYDVTAEGTNLVVRVNGAITAIMVRADPTGGFIALQHWEKGTVRFRNVRIALL
jgi:hypothetical protein